VQSDANMIMNAGTGFRKGLVLVQVTALAILLTLAVGCDNQPVPAAPSKTPAHTHTDVKGPFDAQAQSIFEHLKQNITGKTLIGYGGRRFQIKFESPVQIKYPPSSDGKPKRAIVHLLHWQVQKNESMKYELLLTFESGPQTDGESWRLISATNRYLGLKDKNGFQESEGFKKLNVMKRVKGNVYDRPILEAAESVLES